ncbi:MAG: hypothetical protein K1X53_15140 [Candidatus Sumerlaeaceae bacterium]|nr:hypothetical protein [Candidatus Sumerlaeaceae bacterium]
MFISRIELHSFGKLTGAYEFSRDRCNVIAEENEFGKSTMVDAILYSFYNFPTAGLRRGELRPKEKYKPWFSPGRTEGFRVVMDIDDLDGKNLRLVSNFHKQQPFELFDRATGKPVELEGMTFGKKYFGMSLQSFTECFFLRQDDRDARRDELVPVIEEAAVSNQRVQDSSIRGALTALAECRLKMEEFSTGAVTPDNLLKRIDEQLAAQQAAIAALEAERERHAREIAAAESHDAEITRLAATVKRLEYDVVAAELAEVEEQLNSHSRIGSMVEEKKEKIRELMAFAEFDPAKLPEAQALFAEWRTLDQQSRTERRRLDDQVLQKTRDLERNLAGFPMRLAGATPDKLARLKTLREVFGEQKQEMARQAERAEQLRSEVAAEGIPLGDYHQLCGRLDALPAADRRAMLEYPAESAALETAMATAEKSAAEAGGRASVAKVQRERMRTMSQVFFAAAAVLAVGAVLLFLLGSPGAKLFGGVCFVAAAALGAIGFLQLHKIEQQNIGVLQPALAQEIAALGEVQKCRQRLDALKSDFEDVMARHSLGLQEVKLLGNLRPYARQVGAYQTAEENLARLQKSFNDTCTQAAEIVRLIVLDAAPQTIDEIMMDGAIVQLEKYFEASGQSEVLTAEGGRRMAGIESLERERAEKFEALTAILGRHEPVEAELGAALEAYAAGCENARKLESLAKEVEDAEIPNPEKLSGLQERAEQCRNLLREKRDQGYEPAADAPPLTGSSRVALQEELEESRARLQELRLERLRAFNECDRAVETWRREGPKLREDVARLEALHDDVTEFREAVRIAHAELSTISEEVFSRWAAALNQRINEVMPMLNPRYRDVEISDDLEVSFFSEETSRRHTSREIQHLSKGARDQLNTALRVSISEYLSAHVGNLPIVLDEPFAHWDDERFVRGMSFLSELAGRHQVILMTCHGWRFSELAAKHPELAGKLRTCALVPLPK